MRNLVRASVAARSCFSFAGLSAGAFTNTSSSGSSSSRQGNVGDYVIAGLGGVVGASTTIAGNATGSGLAYAESCNADYLAYSSSALSYANANEQYITETTNFTQTVTWISASFGQPTSYTTLCDGHARVVGQTAAEQSVQLTSTTSGVYTEVNEEPGPSYPGPTPTCSIGPDDCKLLQNSYSSQLSALQTLSYYTDPLEPFCGAALSSTSAPYVNNTCNDCLIQGDGAKLLYWPVMTVPGSGDLCNKTAQTITASAAVDPVTFVTNGLTITSPSVAISFSGLRRADGCGTTVATTIVAVDPDQVSSVRGYRVFFSYYPFDYADMNYNCPNNVSSDVAPADRNDCYQAVPATAYFGGMQEDSVINELSPAQEANLTILNNYNPYVLLPAAMTKAIGSIWGASCIVYPDGVWDPPTALTAQASEAGPSMGAGAGATTTEPGAMIATSTPAAPAGQSATSVAATTGVDTQQSTSSPDLAVHTSAASSSGSGSTQNAAGASTSANGDSGGDLSSSGGSSLDGGSSSSRGSLSSGGLSGAGGSSSDEDPPLNGGSSSDGGSSGDGGGSSGDGGGSSGDGGGSSSDGGSSSGAGSSGDGGGSFGDGDSSGGGNSSGDEGSDEEASSNSAADGGTLGTSQPEQSPAQTSQPGDPAAAIASLLDGAGDSGQDAEDASPELSQQTSRTKQDPSTASQTISAVGQDIAGDPGSGTDSPQSGQSPAASSGATAGGPRSDSTFASAVGSQVTSPNGPLVPITDQANRETFTIGSATVTQALASNGVQVLAIDGSTVTLSASGSAATLDGMEVSALSDGGLAIGTGSGASTLANPRHTQDGDERVLTIGSLAYTVVPDTVGGWDLVDASTTITVVFGQATTVGSVVISEASDGLIVRSGSVSSTITSAGSGSRAASGKGAVTMASTNSSGGKKETNLWRVSLMAIPIACLLFL